MAPRTRRAGENASEGKTTARSFDGATTVTRRANARARPRAWSVENDVVGNEAEGSLGRGAGAPARAEEAGVEDAHSDAEDAEGRWTNTNTTSEGDSDGSGGLRELRRFIHPAVLKHVLAGKKSEAEAGRTSGRRLRRAAEWLITSTLSVSSNNVLHVHRFYAWMYFTFALLLENYLMVRGVRISGQTRIGLDATADPKLWLRGVYTRYLPMALAIDYFVLFMFFDVDEHGRARKDVADLGLFIRHVVKSIMRQPLVTMFVTGYPYPGHCFESAQVVTLLLSPVLSPIAMLDAFQSLRMLLCVCAVNFILYPSFFLEIRAVHPEFLVNRDVSPNATGWMTATFAPIALRAWLLFKCRLQEFREPPKNGIDTFFITRGVFFRLWRRLTDTMAPEYFNRRMSLWHTSNAPSSQESDHVRKEDVEAVAEELNMPSKELCEVLDGVRVMFLPIQTGFLQKRALKHLMQTFMETYREDMERAFASVQIDFRRQEIWLRGIPLRPNVDRMADRLRLCVKEMAATGLAQHLSIRTVSCSTLKYRIKLSHVGAPLHFMHTSTCETQDCSIVGSTVVAIAKGSAHVVRFIGKNLESISMTARVGSGSLLPALGGRHLKWIGGDEVTKFDVSMQQGQQNKLPAKDDDDELLSDDVESYQITTVALLAPWRRPGLGHFEVQGATVDGDISSAYGLIVTTNDALIEEINARFAHKILSSSDRVFILLVGHALGGECSERVEQLLANIARARSLPALAHVLDHLRDERRAS